MINLFVEKIVHDAKLPTRKHKNDAGLDLYAYTKMYDDAYGEFQEIIERIFPRSFDIIHTGIKIELPPDTFGWITNKSSKDYLIGGGIIDPGYRGELLVKVINPYTNVIQIHHGEAIAQLLIIPCLFPEVTEVIKLDMNTERGITGGIVGQLEMDIK